MSSYNSRMAAKLGLKSPDSALVNQLLVLMGRSGADWTNAFRCVCVRVYVLQCLLGVGEEMVAWVQGRACCVLSVKYVCALVLRVACSVQGAGAHTRHRGQQQQQQ